MSDWEPTDPPPDPMCEPIDGEEIDDMETTAQPGFRIVIEASQWDETRISAAVLERLSERFDEKLREKAHKALERAVDAAVARVVDAKILEQAEVMLREGWTQTNEYGEPRGSKVSFAQRVSKLLESPSSYGSRTNNLEDLVKRLVEEAINKSLKPEIEAAREKVRQLLDGTLANKLLQAMKEGVGLRG